MDTFISTVIMNDREKSIQLFHKGKLLRHLKMEEGRKILVGWFLNAFVNY